MKRKNEIIELRNKLLDVEEIANKLEDINNIFTSFAAENSPEGTVIAELIAEQLNKFHDVIKF